MPKYISPEEVRAEQVTRMGNTLGSQFHELYNEFIWLNDKWREYTELFGTSPERINLLDRAAPRFFAFLQHALFEDTLLHIARLTDSPRSGGHHTLSIQRLPQLIDNPQLKADVSKR